MLLVAKLCLNFLNIFPAQDKYFPPFGRKGFPEGAVAQVNFVQGERYWAENLHSYSNLWTSSQIFKYPAAGMNSFPVGHCLNHLNCPCIQLCMVTHAFSYIHRSPSQKWRPSGWQILATSLFSSPCLPESRNAAACGQRAVAKGFLAPLQLQCLTELSHLC